MIAQKLEYLKWSLRMGEKVFENKLFRNHHESIEYSQTSKMNIIHTYTGNGIKSETTSDGIVEYEAQRKKYKQRSRCIGNRVTND